jgi:hypothetical protein
LRETRAIQALAILAWPISDREDFANPIGPSRPFCTPKITMQSALMVKALDELLTLKRKGPSDEEEIFLRPSNG